MGDALGVSRDEFLGGEFRFPPAIAWHTPHVGRQEGRNLPPKRDDLEPCRDAF